VIRERHTDILIVGGGLGGVAAALSALRLGRAVILTEETEWIGGQLTAQAVPPDEHP
jgi:NADPH-dependent 2,4-dienoyl-CoA reductase/sulfur reductase-like enzyme